MSKRAELLQKAVSQDKTVDTENILKKDMSSLKKLEASLEDDLIKVEDSISALLGKNIAIGEEFLNALEEKERIEKRLKLIETVRATYLK